MSRRLAMTATKLRPLSAKQAAIPTMPIANPATAGPMIRAALKIDELRPTALPMSSRPTSSTTNDWRVGMSIAFETPSRNARTRMCHTSTRPVAVRIASANASAICTVWVRTSVRRFGR
jgi:hypothetical protein